MATPLWSGNSLEVKQVTEWDFGGAWIATETITITINGKALDVLAGSTMIATIIATVQAALADITDDDFDAIEWTEDTVSKVIGEAVVAGIPFSVTFSTDSAAGTITPSTTTANKSKNDWGNADCYDGNVPVSTDTPKFANSSVSVRHGLDQSGVTLDSLDVLASYTGDIGQLRYPSSPAFGPYKGTSDRYLNIGITDLLIGFGEGAGSQLLYFDVAAVQLNALINKTAIPTNGETYAVKLLGTNANNVVTVNSGRVAIADEPDQVSTVLTLNVGQKTNPADSLVFCGPGVTLTTLNASGGTTILESGATTLNIYGGTVEIVEGAYTNVNVFGGTLVWKTPGTVGTLKIFDDGHVDCTKDMRAKTVTNSVQMTEGTTLDDPYGTIGLPVVIDPQNCQMSDLDVNLGINVGATYA